MVLQHQQDSSETLLSGHGEMHLRVIIERLEGRNQIPVERHAPAVPYRETIRKSVTQRGRHKKQSGGHGQFGDVVIDIKPLPRGSGFQFTETVTGGVVPRQYIPSVESGVRDFLKSGPLGFPVVDLAVNLVEGSYHSVDSSDMAFQMAAKIAMKEGMAACSPVLLEPIMKVEVYTPSDATAKATAIVSQRRGHILGFDARPGWPGWDILEATMPLSEISDLIIELQIGDGGRGKLQGALRPHGRADRPAGRRCDERKSEGSLSECCEDGASGDDSAETASDGPDAVFCGPVSAREAETARSAARALVFWQTLSNQRTRLFATDSGRCPHPPTPTTPPRPGYPARQAQARCRKLPDVTCNRNAATNLKNFGVWCAIAQNKKAGSRRPG